MQVAFRHDVGSDLRYLIARVTGAPVHCVMIHGTRCYDATFSGLIERTADDRFKEGRWEIFDVSPWYNFEAAEAYSIKRVGWLYDWIGVLFAWWMGRVAGEGHRKKVFCSEHCAGALLAAGVPLLYRRAARFTPRKLRDELRDRFGWTSTWVTP